MRIFLALLLVITALAGCVSTGPASAPAEQSEDRMGSSVREGRDGFRLVAELNATGCEGSTFVAFVPHQAVSDELPPGYEASVAGGSAIPGQGLNNPHLFAVRCATIYLDGTVAVDVGLAASGTLLEQGDFYRWEFFVDEASPLVLPRLQALGWPATSATISGGPEGIVVAADGISYATTALTEQTHESFEITASETHHLGADGVPRLLDEGLNTGTTNDKITAATLQASGGTWGRITGRTVDPLAGATNPIHSDWPMAFYVPN